VSTLNYDVGIVGGGPAGFTAAVTASKGGAKTLIVEKSLLGGTCLNRGCIPTKSYLHTAFLYKKLNNCNKLGIRLIQPPELDFKTLLERTNTILDFVRNGMQYLLKKHKISYVPSEAFLKKENGNYTLITKSDKFVCKKIIIATGSSPVNPFNVKDNRIIFAEDFFKKDSLPKSPVIVGGSVTGMEFATFFSCINIPVTVIEIQNKILAGVPEHIVKRLMRKFKKQKINIITSTSITGLTPLKENIRLTLSNGNILESDLIIIAAGRTSVIPQTENVSLAIKNHKIETTPYLETSRTNIYAAGDVASPLMLAHVAEYMGKIAAMNALGNKKTKCNLDNIPWVIFTSPEIAGCGKVTTDKRLLHFKINSMAYIHEDSDSLIEFYKENNSLRGIIILSEMASELLSLPTFMLQHNINYNLLNSTVFYHPSISEIFNKLEE